MSEKNGMSVGWGTWLHKQKHTKHNLIWSTRVKTDLTQRFKVVRKARDAWKLQLCEHMWLWKPMLTKDLKLSEKKGMSVGGRGPTLFLFVLLCQCPITDVDIILLLLPMLLLSLLLLIESSDKRGSRTVTWCPSLLFIFGKCSQLKEEEIIILVTWNWKATFLLSINSMTQTDGKVKKLDRWGIAAHCQGFLTCVIISSGYRIQETGNRKPNISFSPMTS